MIIGITGTLGAGKGTIVEYLTGQGFTHFSVRDYLGREILRRGLPVNRDTLTDVANDLRAARDPSCIAEALYDEARAQGGDAVIESLRTPGEITALREKGGFILFAVDCDIRTRYERIRERKSATDAVSFETFRANEEREMHSTDPNKQNLARCMELADHTFDNSGSVAGLHDQVALVLKEIRDGR